MQQPNKKLVLIIGSAVVVFIFIVIALLGQHTAPPPQKSQDYIGNTNTPETTLQPTAASLVGFEGLINLGITLDQVNGLQTAFQHYKSFASANTVIDMSGSEFTSIAPSQTDPLYRPSISTTVLINQKTTYHIRFYYWGTSTIELLIYDPTGQTQLFDSGKVVGKS